MAEWLLKCLSFMLYPAIEMPACGISMGPVNNATLGIPFVFPIKFHRVPFSQGIDPWSKVDIVRNQHSLAGCQFNNKSLMPATFLVVRQEAGYRAFTSNLDVTLLISERLL